MPVRKKPASLQSVALRRIGLLFKNSCENTVKDLITVLQLELEHLSFAQLKALKSSVLCDAIAQIQKCLFVETAFCFHERIVTECLVALTEALNQIDGEDESLTSVYISPIEVNLRSPIFKRRDIFLEFLDILCFPGSRIKSIDVSIDKLGIRWKLNKSILTGLSDRLIHMPFLEELNFGHWSCRNLSLLADHNQSEGFPLEYLPNLTTLKLHDVSQKFFQSVGSFCPNLKKLHIFGSDINDTVTWWVSKCQCLETVELFDDKGVTPVGYAQLLRSNPQLKSLGKCDCFGKVLFMLYDNSSMYRRSYANMPEHLSLEEVDTNGELSPLELKHLVKRCPNLKKLRFKYHRSLSEEQEHLALLSSLDYLTQLSISCANFFEHEFFHLLELRGDQLVHLELVDVDEVNLNAILMLGAHCQNLQKLCLHGCHFQMQPEDTVTVESICKRKLQDPGKPKRLRLTSTSSFADTQDPFLQLRSLDVYLTSPAHMPIFQYLLNQAINLEVLIFDQFYCDYNESLVNRSFFEWNSLAHLKELSIGHGSQLSIVTVNVIIANCHQLAKLGRLDQWGQVNREQINSIRNEIQARNFDLVIEAGDAPAK